MLGETPLPAKTRSVFDYLSKKDRERLQAFRETRTETRGEPSTQHSPSPGPAPRAPGVVFVPPLHPSIAKAALSGFQPFTADAVKHARYTTFLTFRADSANEDAPAGKLGFGPFPAQTADEFNKELEDYAKAATVFKPLSGAMAGRFRSAAIVEAGPTVTEGLRFASSGDAEGEGEGGEEDKEEKKVEEDPKTGAVRLGMYGPLTRETTPWQPAKLLCKRFGVKEPEVNLDAQAGEASAKAGFSFATQQEQQQPEASGSVLPIAMIAGVEGGDATDAGAGSSSSRGPRNLANVGLGEDETQGRDILTYERPAMDVFKAIFASDDEDSDDEGIGAGADEDDLNTVPMADRLDGSPMEVDAVVGPNPTPTPAATSGESVDLATFKPTFVPRAERETRKDRDKDKGRKKEKKDKKTKATLVSFDVEDDGAIPSFGPSAANKKDKRRDKDRDKDRDRERKKKRKEEPAPHRDVMMDVDAEDDSMWVEKPAPDVVKAMVFPDDQGRDEAAAGDGREAAGQRGRKRAVDFM